MKIKLSFKTIILIILSFGLLIVFSLLYFANKDVPSDIEILQAKDFTSDSVETNKVVFDEDYQENYYLKITFYNLKFVSGNQDELNFSWEVGASKEIIEVNVETDLVMYMIPASEARLGDRTNYENLERYEYFKVDNLYQLNAYALSSDSQLSEEDLKSFCQEFKKDMLFNPCRLLDNNWAEAYYSAEMLADVINKYGKLDFREIPIETYMMIDSDDEI